MLVFSVYHVALSLFWMAHFDSMLLSSVCVQLEIRMLSLIIQNQMSDCYIK